MSHTAGAPSPRVSDGTSPRAPPRRETPTAHAARKCRRSCSSRRTNQHLGDRVGEWRDAVRHRERPDNERGRSTVAEREIAEQHGNSHCSISTEDGCRRTSSPITAALACRPIPRQPRRCLLHSRRGSERSAQPCATPEHRSAPRGRSRPTPRSTAGQCPDRQVHGDRGVDYDAVDLVRSHLLLTRGGSLQVNEAVSVGA